MNNNMTDKKRYKLSNEIIGDTVNDNDYNNMDSNNENRWKIVVHYGILALICVMSFLIAKYIVRSEIDGEKSPIDTSERL